MDTKWLESSIEEIMESIHNGMIIIDTSGTIVMCNRKGCDLIGYPRDEIIGKPINEIIKDTELVEVLRDGKERPLQQQQVRDRNVIANRSPIYKDGELIGAVSVFQDITELKTTLSRLNAKEQELTQMKEILELLYDGIVMVDDQARITMINQKYCDFLGVRLEEAIGKHVTEVIEHSRLHVVLKTGQPEIGAMMKAKDREIVVMRLPIRKDGAVTGAIGKVMFTDLHELKTLAQRLNVAESKLDYYRNELKKAQGSKYSFEQIIGTSENMREAKSLALSVSKSRSTVLIRGESGTGKELFAHAIHGASSRSEGPFVRINCAAIPAELLESELFGYEDGAFTGAKKGGKPGKVELAEGGTLFLDEIGDMPLNMQVKLLRFLQEKEFERIGGTRIQSADIRIIAATNRPLEEMVQRGEFREDLYYRLNVFHIHIPPLRERGADIITTAQFILGCLNNDLGKSIRGFHPEVEDLFMNYQWTGNVRELQNIIERSLHIAEDQIELNHLPTYLLNLDASNKITSYSLEKELEKTEMNMIKLALKECGGNRNKAAKLLGIHRASLYRKLEKHGIENQETLSQ
jgi:PAS domain S-box-containing protein